MHVEVEGAEIYCEVVGRGAPLLLMHGGPGLDHTAFRPWLDPLADGCRMIYYDHRGNGRSSRPESWHGIGHDTWVADADDLRHFLGCDRIVVFGHSYGGYLALEYALRHADRVRGLVLCSTAGRFLPPDRMVRRAERLGSPQQARCLRSVMADGIADDEGYAAVFATLLPLYFHRPDAAVMQTIVAATRFSAAALNHAFAECYPSFDVLADVDRLEVPTLVLAGRHDWVFAPEESAGPLHAAIPGSRLEIFEDSGHYPFIEERDAVLATLRGWMEALG